MKKIKISITINGKKETLRIDPNLRLLDLLRDELRLTGTKEGCGIGECGACTVIMDGKAVNSCLVLAGQCNGREIITIEGLARGGTLHPLQQAFIDHGAVHCGFCTPGMVMSAKALLDDTPSPSEEEIQTARTGTRSLFKSGIMSVRLPESFPDLEKRRGRSGSMQCAAVRK